MAGVNKVILLGRLGKDPELRYTPTGVAVCNFSIATSEKFKNKDGEQQEKTEWHNIVIWKNLAEIAGKYLAKGKEVYLEGKIQNRSWDKDDGTKGYITEIVAYSMQMIGKADGGDNSSEQRSVPAQAPAAPEQPFNPDDDIPF